jgi:hypothetical protein
MSAPVLAAARFRNGTDLSAFLDLLQRELPDLLGQERSRFVNCGWICQQLTQTRQTRHVDFAPVPQKSEKEKPNLSKNFGRWSYFAVAVTRDGHPASGGPARNGTPLRGAGGCPRGEALS